MRRQLLLVVLVLAVFVSAWDEKCTSLSKIGQNCDFYTQCLESKYKCGADGYPIGYGDRYCNKFLHFYNEFPPKGQEWISNTLTCLKHALVPEFSTCEALKQTAFDSHPQCYYESGFCDLFIDWGNIKQTVKALLKVYDIKDFKNAMAFKQVFETSKMCGLSYTVKIAKVIKELFFNQNFLENLEDNFEDWQ